MNKKTVLITGASSGIGRATAIELSQRGYSVYAGARRMDRLRDLECFGIHPVQLDVTDEISMTSCVNEIFENEGSIDILINNAGYGSYGAVEGVPLSEGRYQMEVLLFGTARLIQLVLPKMRENHYGKIVNVTSMGGRIWTMLGAWYHAGKFAVEGFSNSLRIETKPFGIDVEISLPITSRNIRLTAHTPIVRKAMQQCCASSTAGTDCQGRSLLLTRYQRR